LSHSLILTDKEIFKMTEEQQQAIQCAHDDLVGAYQYAIRDGNGGADNGHDWKSHRQSIELMSAHSPS